jgi:hypothetical protein
LTGANHVELTLPDNGVKNTSGETKVTVYKRIGEVVLPDLFKINPGVVGERVKSKVES